MFKASKNISERINFKPISQLFLVFLLLTLNRQMCDKYVFKTLIIVYVIVIHPFWYFEQLGILMVENMCKVSNAH